MARIDYHLHTTLCKHAEGSIDQYVMHAVETGLDEIGFADHNPMPRGFDSPHRMDSSQLDHYWKMVRRAQKAFPQISIKCGLEADYLPGGEAFLKRQVNSYPFDYIYGSIHFIGDWNFDNPVFVHMWEHHDVDEIYARYFECLGKLIQSRIFDIIAHPDLIKKFGHRPKTLDLDSIYQDTCRRLREADMCLEVNTSGLRKPVGEIYPSARLLECAAKEGVPVVIGSDAHMPSHVGADYDKAAALIKSAGYTHIQQFSRRRRIPVPL